MAMEVYVWDADTVYVGFTGTQEGMTKAQLVRLAIVLARLPEGSKLVHGGCVGADEQAHKIAKWCGLRTEVYPSNITGKRGAFADADIVHEPMPPLDRNWHIADQDMLLATPRGTVEEVRSGTWSTVRRARSKKTPTEVIWPNGDITEDKG